MNVDNYKYSCLNQRAILYENELIQIGSVVNRLDSKKIRMILYFGNKTSSVLKITDFKLQIK